MERAGEGTGVERSAGRRGGWGGEGGATGPDGGGRAAHCPTAWPAGMGVGSPKSA